MVTTNNIANNDSKSNSMKIIGDNPITLPEEDTVGRNSLAKLFAKQILSIDTSKGSVIGVLGAWGSGKTSYINLVRDELKQKNITVLDFNPWMFSGTEQLMHSFFSELSAQLKLNPRLSKIGDTIGTYGDILTAMDWIPLIGPWFQRGLKAAKVLGRILEGRKIGVGAQRKKIEDALIKYGETIIVVIDDIDRLSTVEIRDIFRLVRLTANYNAPIG